MAAAAKINKTYYRWLNYNGYGGVVIHKLKLGSYIHFFTYHNFATSTNTSDAFVECFASYNNWGKVAFYYRIKGYSHDIDNRQYAIGYYIDGGYMYIVTAINGSYVNEMVIYNKGAEDAFDEFDATQHELTKFLSGSNF